MKKNAIALFLIFFITTQSFSMCSAWSIDVWPRTKEISLNSLFIVEGYGSSQNVITNLNKKHQIYLKSETTKIPLEVVKVCFGQFRLTQAILKPTKQLNEGTTYTLEIDSLSEYEKNDFYYNDFKWTVSNISDTSIPLWKSTPSYSNKVLEYYGCGPACFVNFCVCINDNSPVLVFTKLKELKTGRIAEYYLTPDSTSLRIGHGMCSGEFNFEYGERYEVSFSLMDASGNINDTLTKAINFISPSEYDSNNKEEAKKCDCPKVVKVNTNKTIYIMFSFAVFAIVGMLMLLKIKNNKKAS